LEGSEITYTEEGDPSAPPRPAPPSTPNERRTLQPAIIAALLSSLITASLTGFVNYWNTQRSLDANYDNTKQMLEANYKNTKQTLEANYKNTERTLEQSRLSFLVTRQENTARELLNQALEVLSLKEGWLLQGANSRTTKLTQTSGLGEKSVEADLWLMPVEVRAVLDEAEWNVPRDAQYYDFLNGRRAWIVRNEILDKPRVYPGKTRIHYPALLSSKGLQELCGWIERVRIAYQAQTLSEDGLIAISLWLYSLAHEDRITVLEPNLSRNSVNFLREIRSRLNSAELYPFSNSADPASGPDRP
jgi:hypothetical protein